jgi:hypothetical protein
MKLKWCILLGLVTLIGIASQQQVCLPNQEIVLRFADDEVAPTDAQDAIANLTKQLLNSGASNIQVAETQEGDYSITYYSLVDVESIKELFSIENNIQLGYIASNQGKPSKESPKVYDIDIFEIKNPNGVFDIGGIQAIERKLENTRFFIPNLFTPAKDIVFFDLDSVLKETYKFRKSIAITIEITSNKIPDGRAGPKELQYHS